MRLKQLGAITLLAIMLWLFTTLNAEAADIEHTAEYFEKPQIVRCTGYCDYGYTKSGQYVRNGIVAGRKEWLGMTAYIWAVDEDGTIGDFLGIYEFLDTGYGINGSLKKGTSIDMWHPSEDAVWDWIGEYGDYVYLQIIDAKG